MTRDEFIEKLTGEVNTYIENFDRFDSDPQLKVIPATLDVALVNGSERSDAVEDSDEAIENAAAAHGMANQETMDYQVSSGCLQQADRTIPYRTQPQSKQSHPIISKKHFIFTGKQYARRHD